MPSQWIRSTEKAWLWRGVAVYALKRAGKVRYVGVTSNLSIRLNAGAGFSHPAWDEVAFMPFMDCDVAWACRVEDRAIRLLRPWCNKTWLMNGQETGPILAVERRNSGSYRDSMPDECARMTWTFVSGDRELERAFLAEVKGKPLRVIPRNVTALRRVINATRPVGRPRTIKAEKGWRNSDGSLMSAEEAQTFEKALKGVKR